MKILKEEFPLWLEANWEKLSDEELEKYNKMLDIITQIVAFYDSNTDGDNAKALKLLEEMQELGSPPEELMQKIASK